MLPSLIETRLTALAELKSIQGAADFAAIKTKGGAPNLTPAAYVVGLREVPQSNDRTIGKPLQRVRHHVAIILVVRKGNDARGDKARAELDVVRAAVKASLYGFAPSDFDALTLGPSGLLDFSGGAIWWQDEFITERYEEAQNG